MERGNKDGTLVPEWMANQYYRRAKFAPWLGPSFSICMDFRALASTVITMFSDKGQPCEDIPIYLGREDIWLYFWYSVLNSWRKKNQKDLCQCPGAGVKVEVLNPMGLRKGLQTKAREWKSMKTLQMAFLPLLQDCPYMKQINHILNCIPFIIFACSFNLNELRDEGRCYQIFSEAVT